MTTATVSTKKTTEKTLTQEEKAKAKSEKKLKEQKNVWDKDGKGKGG